jgi:hypothetical protein
MKNIVKIFFYVVVSLALSCEENLDKPQGTLDFTFSQIRSGANEQEDEVQIGSFIISLENSDNEIVLDSKTMEIINEDGVYHSKPISLPFGDYTLSKFVVLDTEGTPIYATPVEGSDYAYLVDHPLPVSFTIDVDKVTTLHLEVINTEGLDALTFGYPVFTFEIVPTISFATAVFQFNPNIGEFELTNARYLVLQGEDTLYDKPIAPETSIIRIHDNAQDITVKVLKENFEDYSQDLAYDDIASYSSEPLIVNLTPSFDLESGLLIYYPFNGDGTDHSGNSNDATISGAALTTDLNDAADHAYYFNGTNDYIEFPDLPEYDQFPLTFSYWVNFSSLNPGVLGTDVTENIESGVWFSIGVEFDTQGKLALNFGNGGGPNAASRKTFVAGNSIETGSWYHVVGTIESLESISIYINGIKAEGEYTGTASSYFAGDNPGKIGRVWQPNASFNGKIDEFRVYNRVLTQAEIEYLAQ